MTTLVKMNVRAKRWMLGTLCVLVVASVFTFLYWRENKMPLPRAVHGFLQTRENHERWDWLHGWRQQNTHRIFARETRDLQLADSRWRDEKTGAVLEFGEDRRIRWISKPSTKSASIPPRINQFVVDTIDGASFEFDRYSTEFYEFQDDGGSMSGSNGNLEIASDPKVHAWIGFDGKILGVVIKGPDSPTPVATGPFGDVYSQELSIYLERIEE